MNVEQAIVGTRVRALIDFVGIRLGTEGVIDEVFTTGVMVAWDFPESPLPSGYREYDGKPAVATSLLRGRFYKLAELQFLEVLCAYVGAGWLT